MTALITNISAQRSSDLRRYAAERLDPGQDFLGGALARAHGAVHVSGPVVGRLGPGPVDATDRLAQPLAARDGLAQARDPDGAAPGPGLALPRDSTYLVGFAACERGAASSGCDYRAARTSLAARSPERTAPSM